MVRMNKEICVFFMKSKEIPLLLFLKSDRMRKLIKIILSYCSQIPVNSNDS